MEGAHSQGFRGSRSTQMNFFPVIDDLIFFPSSETGTNQFTSVTEGSIEILLRSHK